MHQSAAEIGDIPRDDGLAGHGFSRQALRSWKRGISTSKALPSSLTMR
jgi:hypothetical protein